MLLYNACASRFEMAKITPANLDHILQSQIRWLSVATLSSIEVCLGGSHLAENLFAMAGSMYESGASYAKATNHIAHPSHMSASSPLTSF